MTSCAQFLDQKILVTGASGFIGSHLCRRLCETVKQVHAISRSIPRNRPSNLQWWEGDLEDILAVRKLLHRINPNIIFHLAGYAVGSRDLQHVLPNLHGNLLTTVNLLTVATEIGSRRILIPGSLEEPDSNEGDAIASSPYAASKWASSIYARMFHELYQTPVVIARIFLTYGPGERNQKKLIPYTIQSLMRGKAPKLGSGKRQIDWIYIDDVVNGIIAAAQASDVEGSTVDVGSGNLVDIRSVVDHLVRLIDSSIEPVFGALGDRPREQIRAADLAPSYQRIGWQPLISLEEGLLRTVEWYRKEINNSPASDSPDEWQVNPLI